jgi:2-polyprenyl-3-methyl-5-hydroxy-6-metoxy-1,4-benzoquinol methylase
MFERITGEQLPQQTGHAYRYELATAWMKPGDKVLDVACGVGYGAKLIAERVSVDYLGVDKITPEQEFTSFGRFHCGVDLMTWQPHEQFDVAVCFETLEHLPNPAHLVSVLKQTKRIILVSVPTRPTKHVNPFHLQDFTVEDIMTLFSDCKLLHLEDQPEELSHIFVFGGLNDS